MSIETLERVWDATTGFLNGIGTRLERSITGLFGSSNARYIKKLQPKIDAINALEPKYQAMSDAELKQQTRRVPEAAGQPGKRSTTCWSRPSPSAARRAAASWECGITTCS